MNRPLVFFVIGIMLVGAAFLTRVQAAEEPVLDAAQTKIEYTPTQLIVTYKLKSAIAQGSNRQIGVYERGSTTPLGLSGVLKPGITGGTFTVNTTKHGAMDVTVVQPLNTGGFVRSGSVQKNPVAITTGSIATNNSDQKKFKDTLFAGPNNDAITAGDYLYRMYVWAVTIAILGATAVIIRAGYVYAVGRGNPSAVTSAKELIVNALVGLALLILSYSILRFILGPRVKTQEPPKASLLIQQNSTQANQHG